MDILFWDVKSMKIDTWGTHKSFHHLQVRSRGQYVKASEVVALGEHG